MDTLHFFNGFLNFNLLGYKLTNTPNYLVGGVGKQIYKNNRVGIIGWGKKLQKIQIILKPTKSAIYVLPDFFYQHLYLPLPCL